MGEIESIIKDCSFDKYTSVHIAVFVFFIATFVPYFIGLLLDKNWRDGKEKKYDKYVSRVWFATTGSFCFALFGFLMDGMDIIKSEIYKYIVVWGMVQGIIFTVTSALDKTVKSLTLSKGDTKLNIEMEDKEK